jgi:imidazoleglycerol-phosphate dehydratase
MPARKSTIKRQTKETKIEIVLALDGSGDASIETGIPFFDHMLESFAVHGVFDLTVRAKGDLNTGDHHTVEDVGIVLGKAFSDALGNKKGIARFGDAMVPMDETLATVALDISGRSHVVFSGTFEESKIGGMSTKNVRHFLDSFAKNAVLSMNIKVEGEDDHHKIEAVFKALGVALGKALKRDERRKRVPSTKKIL